MHRLKINYIAGCRKTTYSQRGIAPFYKTVEFAGKNPRGIEKDRQS